MLRLRWFHFTVVPCDAPYEGFITGGSLLAAPLNEAKSILNTILHEEKTLQIDEQTDATLRESQL